MRTSQAFKACVAVAATVLTWHVSVTSRGDLVNIPRSVNVSSDGWFIEEAHGVVLARKNVSHSRYFKDLAARVAVFEAPQVAASRASLPHAATIAMHPTKIELTLSRRGKHPITYVAVWRDPGTAPAASAIEAIAHDIELLDS